MEKKYFLNMLVMSNNDGNRSYHVTDAVACIGADVTNVFEGVGHTQDARDLAKQYLIGTITGQVSQFLTTI